MIEIPENSGYYYDINPSEAKIIAKKDNIEIPRCLYKFYPLNENSVNAFVEQKIYASHPFQFNDPYDNTRFLMRGAGVSDDLYQLFYSMNGILCLTDPQNWNSLLMWGLYCNNEGYSILFDYKKFRFKTEGPFPLNYQEGILSEDYFTKKNISNQYIIFYLMTLKNKLWKHEKEYRLILSKDKQMNAPKIDGFSFSERLEDRFFAYSKEAILEVNLGYYFIFNSDCVINEGHSLIIKTYDFKRISILTKIISDNYKSYIMRPALNLFELQRDEVKIVRIDQNSFKFLYCDKR